MKTIVVYKSRTGFTMNYAKWIQEALNCDIKELKEMTSQDYDNYERVIYGSSLMAGKIRSLDEVKKHAYKELIIFAVGLISCQDADRVMDRIRNDNLDVEEQKSIPLFYFQGGVNYDKLPFVQKKMLRMIYKSLLKKENKNDEQLAMMTALKQSHDYTEKGNIAALIEMCKKES